MATARLWRARNARARDDTLPPPRAATLALRWAALTGRTHRAAALLAADAAACCAAARARTPAAGAHAARWLLRGGVAAMAMRARVRSFGCAARAAARVLRVASLRVVTRRPPLLA
jgi:hypothetical protein